MNCFNCGAKISLEDKNCPMCGSSLQMVPDYSIYDDDDINVLMEGAKKTEPVSTPKPAQTPKELSPAEKKRNEERIRARKEKERQKALALEKKKQKQMIITILVIAFICIVLFVAAFAIKNSIERNNASSYDYQIKMAEAALNDGDIVLAEDYYLKALALEEYDLDVRFILSDLYLKSSRTEDAVKLLKEIILIDKTNYAAYKQLFQIYNDAGNVDAIMQLKEGVTDSRILALFVNYEVEKPLIHLTPGNYANNASVMITAKLDCEIYYTTDGSDPIKNGVLYTQPVIIDKMGLTTLKAVAKNDKGIYSSVISATYNIEYKAPDEPIVFPDGGVFDKETYITISVPDGCTAYYTWDQTDPTIDSQTKFEYTDPILIPSGTNVLSVIIYDDKTGLCSGIYRRNFECMLEGIEVPIIVLPESESESNVEEVLP